MPLERRPLEESAALKEEIQHDDLQQVLNHLLVMLAQFPEQEYWLGREKTDDNG